MTAPPKTNRKLRKERKNRAKKVCLVTVVSCAHTYVALLLAPWYQKDQGSGSTEEEVVVLRCLLSLLSLVASLCILHTIVFAKVVSRLYLTRMPAFLSLLMKHYAYAEKARRSGWMCRHMVCALVPRCVLAKRPWCCKGE